MTDAPEGRGPGFGLTRGAARDKERDMGLFNTLNGMGPGGVQEREPRTALGRFWQIYTHHSLGLLGSGILASVTALVYIASLYLGVESHGLIFVLVGCPLGGMIAMPQILGVADTALRGIRGEAGFWWMKYRRAWKNNLRQSLAFGFFVGLLFGFQYFIIRHTEKVPFFVVVLMLAGIFIAVAAASWCVPQIVLMELPLRRIVMNSITLSAQHPLKTLGVVAVTVLYWFAIMVTYPFSLLFYVLFGFWLPMLICLMVMWRPIDDAFDITEKIDELNAKKRAEEKAAEAAEMEDQPQDGGEEE